MYKLGDVIYLLDIFDHGKCFLYHKRGLNFNKFSFHNMRIFGRYEKRFHTL